MNRVARLMLERLGPDQAKRLTEIAGGTRLSVPANLTGTGHHCGTLRRRVGDDLFVLLVLHFGGTRLYVPRGAHSAQVDARTVRRLSRKGWSASRIARKLGCSDRTVYAKRAEPRTAQSSKGSQNDHETA